MFAEAAEAGAVVARQAAANAKLIADLAVRLRALAPRIIVTCARGSSDHAASFAKYLFETTLRIPTLSQAPSISSVYGAPLQHLAGQPFVLISQSGRSPDLLLSAEAARNGGALVIAFVNDAASPLAQMADVFVPLHAGPETSVAATKSYIASLAALVHLTALWAEDAPMADAHGRLPDDLAQAWQADWSSGAAMLQSARSLFVLGRGLTFGIAQEAALKFKEICALHGEAFSAAEVAHGPMALVGPDFPVFAFPPFDKARAGFDATLEAFAARGVPIAIAGGGPEGAVSLPLAEGLHAATGPIAMVQSFYRMASALAVARGLDPDAPPMLRKVTETR
jgi:glutamine---fructose-6-phosphate transaminase (isomerizing)